MLVDPYALPAGLFTNNGCGLASGLFAMVVPGRNRIMSSPAPWMTTAQPAHAQPRSSQNSVCLEGFEKVGRTRRFKATTRPRPAQEREHWREQELVAANKKTREEEHQGAKIEARSARRNHSSFSAR
jgi:hypothetical protein